jgi:tryptophan-rich sensory protein
MAPKEGRRPRAGAVSIAGAAIRYSDLGVRALPLPASHDDIRELVAQLHGSRGGKHKGEVGFITDRGGFVKAKEALVIARHAGQLGQARIRSDELCLEYLHREDAPGTGEATRPWAKSQPRPAGPGPSVRWGRSRRPAGQLVSQHDLRRQLVRTSTFVVALLLLVWLLANGLPQFAAGVTGGVVWQKLAAQAALYMMMGLAVAHVIHARGARFRSAAIAAFILLVALTFLWPLAVSLKMEMAMTLAGSTLLVAVVTFALFARIRLGGALLLAPCVACIAISGYAAHAPAALAHSSLALFN